MRAVPIGDDRALSSSSFKAFSELIVAGEQGIRGVLREALRSISPWSRGEVHDGASKMRSLVMIGGGIGGRAT